MVALIVFLNDALERVLAREEEVRTLIEASPNVGFATTGLNGPSMALVRTLVSMARPNALLAASPVHGENLGR
jgi:hypothetical protein